MFRHHPYQKHPPGSCYFHLALRTTLANHKDSTVGFVVLIFECCVHCFFSRFRSTPHQRIGRFGGNRSMSTFPFVFVRSFCLYLFIVILCHLRLYPHCLISTKLWQHSSLPVVDSNKKQNYDTTTQGVGFNTTEHSDDDFIRGSGPTPL
jgi:hypothetical protein